MLEMPFRLLQLNCPCPRLGTHRLRDVSAPSVFASTAACCSELCLEESSFEEGFRLVPACYTALSSASRLTPSSCQGRHIRNEKTLPAVSLGRQVLH
jgi:hypothetical protein